MNLFGSLIKSIYLYTNQTNRDMDTLELMTGLKEKINTEINIFPYSNSYISTLGGNDHAAILFVIGLDKKETWSNGIFENSRYCRFHIENTRKGLVMECFTTHKTTKFRKFTGSESKLIERLKKNIVELQNL